MTLTFRTRSENGERGTVKAFTAPRSTFYVLRSPFYVLSSQFSAAIRPFARFTTHQMISGEAAERGEQAAQQRARGCGTGWMVGSIRASISRRLAGEPRGERSAPRARMLPRSRLSGPALWYAILLGRCEAEGDQLASVPTDVPDALCSPTRRPLRGSGTTRPSVPAGRGPREGGRLPSLRHIVHLEPDVREPPPLPSGARHPNHAHARDPRRGGVMRSRSNRAARVEVEVVAPQRDESPAPSR